MEPQVFIHALPEMVTQLLGFLIVFFILKKFAFGPVLGIIDARQKKIENEFLGIEKQKQELEKLEKEYRQRLDKIEQEARTKIQEAANVGLTLARDVQENARVEAQKLIARAQDEIKQDLTKAKLTLRDEIVELSGLITEKILKEKLDVKEHERLVDQFLKELEKV